MPPKKTPQQKPTSPAPRGQTQPPFLFRFVPNYGTPEWWSANLWREVVRRQPIAISCRDTLIAFLLGTEWQIRARNPNETERYKSDIDYYMELFESLNGMDFDMTLDLVCQDVLDTPFGGAMELGRLGDVPDGRTVWARHMDAATLYPTRDWDFPIAQRIPNAAVPVVIFPRHAISRAYYTPRPEWQRLGWGSPPPEKIYLAIELISRGDRYYANLLLDTPEAGILDLLDMEKESAMEWLESFQELFVGQDPFKVPVLYEHTTKAEWIPFGRPPTELMYADVTFKYAQIVCAGYGLKISDIGLSMEEARTLAGVIRAERQTRRTGFATLKSKTASFFQNMLPRHLVFEWLDQDDESMLARGRSRLANFQAYAEAREKKMLTLEEVRAQIAADGLLDIQIDPDDPDAKAELMMMELGADVVRLPRTDDRDRVPPSDGGQGQLTFPRKSAGYLVTRHLLRASNLLNDARLRRLAKAMSRELYPTISKVFKELHSNDLNDWAEGMVEAAFDNNGLDRRSKRAFESKKKVLDKHLKADDWWKIKAEVEQDDELEDSVKNSITSGIETAQSVIGRILYEEAKINNPDLPEFNFPGGNITGKSRLVGLVDTADISTELLIKAACMAASCQAFAVPTVYQSIQAGTSMEDLLRDPSFLSYLTSEFDKAIKEIFKSNSETLTRQIDEALINLGIESYMSHVGLKKGEWTYEDGKLVVDEGKLLTIADRKDFLK